MGLFNCFFIKVEYFLGVGWVLGGGDNCFAQGKGKEEAESTAMCM